MLEKSIKKYCDEGQQNIGQELGRIIHEGTAGRRQNIGQEADRETVGQNIRQEVVRILEKSKQNN
jgi:hypothetical protein